MRVKNFLTRRWCEPVFDAVNKIWSAPDVDEALTDDIDNDASYCGDDIVSSAILTN